MLALGRPVADFALSADPQSVLQRVRFALVEADLDAALHVGVQDPFDHEQRPFDAADLAQGDGKVVLAGIGRQLGVTTRKWRIVRLLRTYPELRLV